MLEMGDLPCNCMVRELFQHHFDVDKAIASTVNEHDWCFYVSGWEFCHFVVPISRSETQWGLHIVIVHVELFLFVRLASLNSKTDRCAIGKGYALHKRNDTKDCRP